LLSRTSSFALQRQLNSAAGQRGADAANGTSNATDRTGETAQLRMGGQRDQRQQKYKAKRKKQAEREPAASARNQASNSCRSPITAMEAWQQKSLFDGRGGVTTQFARSQRRKYNQKLQ
jgi:hypothetical protein